MGISKKSEKVGDKPSSVKINGQKVAEGQAGTTRVPRPPEATR
jgi:hypothetical protein